LLQDGTGSERGRLLVERDFVWIFEGVLVTDAETDGDGIGNAVRDRDGDGRISVTLYTTYNFGRTA